MPPCWNLRRGGQQEANFMKVKSKNPLSSKDLVGCYDLLYNWFLVFVFPLVWHHHMHPVGIASTLRQTPARPCRQGTHRMGNPTALSDQFQTAFPGPGFWALERDW